MSTITPFFRSCPVCAAVLYYDTERAAKLRAQQNKPCAKCRNRKPPPSTEKLVRSCPGCRDPITYKTRSACQGAAQKEQVCRKCSKQRAKERWTPERKLAESQRMKDQRAATPELWLNEESVRKKSESLKAAHARPDAPWRTPEWRAQRSWAMSQQALSGTHPFQHFTPEKITEMAQKSRATNLTSGSAFQQHVAWRNTDEGHAWLSEIAKKSRSENSVFQTDEYKAKIRAHLTGARKKVKKSKSSKYERALAEALHAADPRFVLNESGPKVSIGPYHPDIVDVERKIVVEFYGDYSHSHPDMYPDEYWNALRHRTARENREFDAKRKAFIESQGWRVIVVWESDWKSSANGAVEHVIRSAS